MCLVVEVRLSCYLVLLSADRKARRQYGRASTTQPIYSTDYALMRHLSHHRLCECACSLLIWEWSRTDRYSPGSPSPLTGLQLWQDPVTGGWPGVVYGCVLLSPCDHARLLGALSIYYLFTAIMIVLWSWWIFLKHDMGGMCHKSLYHFWLKSCFRDHHL